MLMRMLYDDDLAQATYLIGCPDAGEAVLIDPARDVDRYIAAAAAEDLRIVAAAETHIHADFVSGVRELCERTGCTALLPGEGGPDWTPRWIERKQRPFEHRLLRDGDTVDVGSIRLRAVHSPGHTPEHIAFVITDTGADDPIAICSGDFVFVGDLGRPDLLETAAGHAGAAEPSARALHASIARFLEFPDYVQVWPGHGAGSACGKALGAVPTSTVGYERRHNPAILAADDERGFVDHILAGQPEPPTYFARMKRWNVEGPPILGRLPDPPRLAPSDVPPGAVILDTRPWPHYRAGHITGSLSTPLDRSFPTVAACYASDTPVVLVARGQDVEQAVRKLIRVGVDEILGCIDPADLAGAGATGASTDEIDVAMLRDRLAAGGVTLLDVRRAAEFDAGHMPGAINITHTQLARRLDEVPRDTPILVSCRTGKRSARAASLLQRHGFDAANVRGGIVDWEHAGYEIVA